MKSQISRREFVTAASAAAGAILLPAPRFAMAAAQDPVVDAVKNGEASPHEVVMWRVEPFPMAHVRLLDGVFKDQLDINQKWLLSLPPDRLLHTFRLNAGISSSAEPLGGWEKPDCELRGHFAGGHYLSACALTYASTGDAAAKETGDTMVRELAKCQEKLGNGYLSAFPEEFFDRLRDGQSVWAPFYTIHKIMAGHVDMYVHCGNEQALETARKMASWVGRWTGPLSEEHMQRVLEVEQGGMLEVLCNLYALTGNKEYLWIAESFYHKAVFDPLAEYRDELKGLHANTNIPKITGCARRYELTGNEKYHDIASYFLQEVVARRTYCSGGTSYGEHWEADPGHLGKELGKDMEECCCGYNMLKLARHIFGWTADPRVMDYYERTLFNSRLGTQDPDGMKSYFLPLAPGYWKYYNSPYDSFWCCTGTGAEEFSKFGDTIYFHDRDGIYVNLFIASEVDWPEKGIVVRQETSFPEEEGTTLILRAKKPVTMALNIRVPGWARSGGSLKLNGESLEVFASPSSYLSVRRVWKDGDRVSVNLPMSLYLEPLAGDETHQAFMFGPLALAGKQGDEGLTTPMIHLGYNPSPAGNPVPVTPIRASSQNPADWIEPAPDRKLEFSTRGQGEKLSLIPLYKISGERYTVYWPVDMKKV